MITYKILPSFVAMAMATLVTGCNSSTPSPGTPAGGPPPPPVVSCDTPEPRSVLNDVLTVNLPQDSDASADPVPTTDIAFTIMLPERCPGQTFPLVLHSHGYGGSRLTALDDDGVAESTDPHFPSLNELTSGLPFHGYVVISFDERGHGESTFDNGGGNARVIDPEAETQDAIALLDWAYDRAAQFQLQTEPGTGIPKDLKVGSIGYSYGGGFQFPLAALDPRIDTIIPNGTWHNLMYSLLPGDAVKQSFDALLCLLATTGGVTNTPVVATACGLMGIDNANAGNIRTRADLAAAGADPINPLVNGNPAITTRAFIEQELVDLFFGHGAGYFQNRGQTSQPWRVGEPPFRQRPVPTLLLQGNRDVIFNLTEAYWNYAYYKQAAGGSADVRLISTEGGHMNPLAYQSEGPANCGATKGVDAMRAWLDFHLKGIASAAYDAIAPVCISVADTPVANSVATDMGLRLNDIPVGSQTGPGAVPALLTTATVSVDATHIGTTPLFVPVATISGADKVLAGVPQIGKLTVVAGLVSTSTPVAYIGTGIRRAGSIILVDDQVTSFLEGEHTGNRNSGNADNSTVLLPGVGERLQDGDEVGVVFYCAHIQYQTPVSVTGTTGAVGLVGFIGGVELPPLAPPAASVCTNLYDVTLENAGMPIVVPNEFPGSQIN